MATKKKAAGAAKRSAAGRLAHEERMAMPLSALAAARASRGWSQAKTADAAGMDVTTYARIERMKVNPFPAQAEAIGRALGLSVDELTDKSVASADAALPSIPALDPIAELSRRVGLLEDGLRELSGELGDVMAHLGEQRAKVEVIEARDSEPVVTDRNGLPIRPGSWYVDTSEAVPAKAAPRWVDHVELHEVEGMGLLAYFPDGQGVFGVASVEGGRCPNIALVEIVERGRKGGAR